MKPRALLLSCCNFDTLDWQILCRMATMCTGRSTARACRALLNGGVVEVQASAPGAHIQKKAGGCAGRGPLLVGGPPGPFVSARKSSEV